mmetsp:Transcript_2604/g.7970  ORF Transcript_2604/g.7970 Transcript_2604/m.7970 type:complete len:131 (-) Transcript_2604:2-394(-)
MPGLAAAAAPEGVPAALSARGLHACCCAVGPIAAASQILKRSAAGDGGPGGLLARAAGLDPWEEPSPSPPPHQLSERDELPPGGCATRVLGVSQSTLPQFCLLPHAKVLEDTRGRAPKASIAFATRLVNN